MSTKELVRQNGLDRYIAEVSRHPLLDRDEEIRLARRWREYQDVSAAHLLVVSNLRFVVKVANEYRGYGLKILDLIQEGNIGLMKAVKKFDPDKGYRLISYAVWWIRAQINEYIMRSWSLVKLGSGRLKRRLFFKLRTERSRIEQKQALLLEDNDSTRELSERFDVSEDLISEMDVRMAARDFSLDAPLSAEAGVTHMDLLGDKFPDQESALGDKEERTELQSAVEEATEHLNDKERFVLDNRLLTDDPQTLADIGKHYGFSRERARQIENQVITKLRERLQHLRPTAA